MHFETCGDFQTWRLAGTEPACQLDYALGLHASGLNAKSRVPPGDFAPAIADFEAHAGYRLQLVEVALDGALVAGTTVPVTLRWHNAGVALPYRGFRVASRVDGRVQILGTIQGLQPGEGTLSAEILLPDTPGGLPLELAILGLEGEDTPRVPMGLAAQDGAGWVTLTTLELSAP